jgi:RNA-binding protein
MTLTAKQKRNLRAQAHHLHPQILIGRNGVNPEQINQIKHALIDHELVKIKFNAHKNQKKTLSKEIIEQTDSVQINLIGNTLIIYRMNPESSKRKINPDSK